MEDNVLDMSTTTERFPVDRLYVWSGLMAVIGLSTLLSSAASILAGSGVSATG